MSRYIYRIVEKLKSKHKTSNPFSLAEHLNIFVSMKELNNLKGFYCIINRERHIVINNSLCQEDKILVCAHELGHDRLHQDLAKISALNDFEFYSMKSKPEYQANIFAADLLLDDKQIGELLNEQDVNVVGKLLNVNPNVIYFKLLSMKKRGFYGGRD